MNTSVDFCFVDSGVGGIPYLTALLQKMPDAACAYVADTANFPYGEKSHERIVDCVTEVVQKIHARLSPRVIVLACNTISVNALSALRLDFPDVQFVGTVPAIKLAASISKKRRIGLLATKATCENPYNKELKEKFAADCELFFRADGELVNFVEKNAFCSGKDEIFKAIEPAADFFKEKDCDTVILGCTHFLNIKAEISKVFGSNIRVVDSVDGVVRHAIDVLSPSKKESCEPSVPSLFITSLSVTEAATQYELLFDKSHINFCGTL